MPENLIDEILLFNLSEMWQVMSEIMGVHCGWELFIFFLVVYITGGLGVWQKPF